MLDFLKVFFLIVEVVSCLMLIGIILLQKSKNEGMGLAFGAGVGESLFGARASNVLTKATIWLGGIFLMCTLLLGVLFSKNHESTLVSDLLVEQPVVVGPVQVEGVDDAPEMLPAGLDDAALGVTEKPGVDSQDDAVVDSEAVEVVLPVNADSSAADEVVAPANVDSAAADELVVPDNVDADLVEGM